MQVFPRPPSVAWEPAALRDAPHASFWVWFFPSAAPLSIQLQVAPEAAHALGPQLTVQALLDAVGLPLAALQGWDVQGIACQVDAGTLPWLTQPLPIVAGVPLLVSLRLHPSPSAPPFPQAIPAAINLEVRPMGNSVGQNAGLFDALEADWLAIQQVDRNLEAARKQLAGLQGRLQSLNRDLNPDERLHADNLDRKDWLDARRWLRDAAAQISRYVREYDIGAVSGAGGRHRFEDLYKTYIAPRKPFEGLAAAQLEFEQYRKTHQSLLVQMQAVLSNAQRDGEQRAQQLLSRIAAKVRAARTKR